MLGLVLHAVILLLMMQQPVLDVKWPFWEEEQIIDECKTVVIQVC